MEDAGSRVVLLIDDDPFQAGYVGVALDRSGLAVIGPLATLAAAEDAIAATPGLCAAVIGGRFPAEQVAAIAATIIARGAACLVLDPTAGGGGTASGPVHHLPQPFGSFQVLDWLRAHVSTPLAEPIRMALPTR